MGTAAVSRPPGGVTAGPTVPTAPTRTRLNAVSHTHPADAQRGADAHAALLRWSGDLLICISLYVYVYVCVFFYCVCYVLTCRFLRVPRGPVAVRDSRMRRADCTLRSAPRLSRRLGRGRLP